jgi:hypothetical protein
MRVTCEIEEVYLTGDSGSEVPSVQATCSRCDHCIESYGTSEASIKRCLVLLREECPEEENNFYVAESEEE